MHRAFRKYPTRELEEDFSRFYKESKKRFGFCISVGGGDFAHPAANRYKEGEGTIGDILNAVKKIESNVTEELDRMEIPHTVYRPYENVEGYGYDHFGFQVFNLGEGSDHLGPKILNT